MSPKRYLIVNADDFGQSQSVNLGIIAAHERGIVTSASLMVRWPAATEAAAYSREQPRFSLGLHFDLGEWVCRDGNWVPLYEVVPTDDRAAVAEELARQLDLFRQLMGKNPTHLDSHQHAHRSEPARSLLIEAARRLAVPLRLRSREVTYCGDFYGQMGTGEPYPEGISLAQLLKILAALPPGVTELGCHPGLGNEIDTMYRAERAAELKVLCDPRVRAAIVEEGITLCSFYNFSR